MRKTRVRRSLTSNNLYSNNCNITEMRGVLVTCFLLIIMSDTFIIKVNIVNDKKNGILVI